LFVAILKVHQAITFLPLLDGLNSFCKQQGLTLLYLHSVRGTSSSPEAMVRMAVSDILKAANWCFEFTLNIFITVHFMTHHLGKLRTKLSSLMYILIALHLNLTGVAIIV